MFREMRRKQQLLPTEDCIAVLSKATSGVLAVSGQDEYPYAVPLNFLYEDFKIYFHCATTGHKLDAIAANSKVSFCVIDEDTIVPERFTSLFRSVIVFGKARILNDPQEKRSALEKLAAKYSPEHRQEGLVEIEKHLDQTCMVEIAIEHMTGKEAIEFVKAKQK